MSSPTGKERNDYRNFYDTDKQCLINYTIEFNIRSHLKAQF